MGLRRVLIVCSGNTCRSPMAAALLAAHSAGLQARLDVRSAGTSAIDGAPATAGALAAMAERGLDLAGHRAVRLDGPLLDWATDVWVMTRRHRTIIERRWPGSTGGRAWLLCEAAGEIGDVPDPFGGTSQDYFQTAGVLDRLVVAALGTRATS